MKKVIFGISGVCIIVLGVYFPVVWWISGIALLLIVGGDYPSVRMTPCAMDEVKKMTEITQSITIKEKHYE